MRFKRRLGVSMAAAATAMLAAAAGNAQTIGERVDAIEKKLEEERSGLASAIGIDVHAMVDVGWLYSFNNPDDDAIRYRVFDPEHNDIDLTLFNLRFSREKEDEPVGFVVNLDFGQTADVVGQFTCWGGGCDPVPDKSENDNSVELREAFGYYKLPWGGIKIKGGKFVTLLGYEIIKNWDGYNPNISNSIMFGNAIPFTHTGFLANIPAGDFLAFDLGVVNGWDTVADNNDSKSFLGGMTIAPMDMLSIYLAATYGAEQPNNGHSKRAVVTAAVSVKPTDMLTFALDVDYGNESDLHFANDPVAFPSEHTAEWYGMAAYAMIQPTDALSFNLRGEWFADPDGTRSGYVAEDGDAGVTVWEITPTMAYKITDGLLARLEYRHDEADDNGFFSKEGHFDASSNTIATEFIYAF